jgi:ubiquinone/menaquinone biosynthesis C-methylase UbiE
MTQGDDVDRFDRWAATYDRHWMQRRIFEPVQRTVLTLAAQEVPQPAAILDVGCGTGRLLRLAEGQFPRAKLVGVDAATEMVRQAAASITSGGAIRFQQATAEELPFPNGQFDLIFSTLTFHHWRDQGKGIAEVARVLAPNGRWLLADFMATGLVSYVRRLLRLTQFPEQAQLEIMLAGAGLAAVTSRRVPGLSGQVNVMAIAAIPQRVNQVRPDSLAGQPRAG